MAKNINVRKSVRTKQPLAATAPRMIAAFNRNVQHLAAKGDARALDLIACEILGHTLNSEWGASELAKALTVLAPLATPELFEFAVYDSIVSRIACTTEDEAVVERMAKAEAERLGVKFAACGCLARSAGISGGVPCCNDFPVPPGPAPAPAPAAQIEALRPAPAQPVAATPDEIAAYYAQLDVDAQTTVARLLQSLAGCGAKAA